MALDALILAFDRALRTLSGTVQAARPSPAADLPEPTLPDHERRESARLMRVNHCGEVCAQALYQGQALATRNERIAKPLREAADEEVDHLAWSAARIEALGGRTSHLNPVWYAGSFVLGYAAGRAGDRWNLAFLRETERQVEAHLASHLERLSPRDESTRAIVRQMKVDEAAHAATAQRLGAATMPAWVRGAMRRSAKVMTGLSYWV
jgi:ubiquinone biosynthesis monooxygenase Coq7